MANGAYIFACMSKRNVTRLLFYNTTTTISEEPTSSSLRIASRLVAAVKALHLDKDILPTYKSCTTTFSRSVNATLAPDYVRAFELHLFQLALKIHQYFVAFPYVPVYFGVEFAEQRWTSTTAALAICTFS